MALQQCLGQAVEVLQGGDPRSSGVHRVQACHVDLGQVNGGPEAQPGSLVH